MHTKAKTVCLGAQRERLFVNVRSIPRVLRLHLERPRPTITMPEIRREILLFSMQAGDDCAGSGSTWEHFEA